MMNPTEFKEFVESAIFSKYEVMFGNDDCKGEGEHFSIENIDQLVNNAFLDEWTAMSIHENNDWIGAFQMKTDYSEKKGCSCIDILWYTDIPKIEEIVEQTRKYRNA